VSIGVAFLLDVVFVGHSAKLEERKREPKEQGRGKGFSQAQPQSWSQQPVFLPPVESSPRPETRRRSRNLQGREGKEGSEKGVVVEEEKEVGSIARDSRRREGRRESGSSLPSKDWRGIGVSF